MNIELEDDNCCFVCGRENPAGLNLDFSFVDGRASAEFILRKSFQGYKDIVHGGVIAAILDEAMIKAALAQGIHAVTAAIAVRFTNPLLAGEKGTVEAEITKSGRKLIEAAASIRVAGSRMIAGGKGKLLIVREEWNRRRR